VSNLRITPGVASTPSLAYTEPPVSPTPINARPSLPEPPVPVAPPLAQPVSPPPVAQPVSPPPVAQPVSPPPFAQPVSPTPAQPPAPAAPAPQPELDKSIAVFLHLSSGERLWVGRYANEKLAEQRAHEIVRTLVRPEPGVWAKFGQRLIRPEAVVSIELANRRED
jgi:hypothetical protein